MKTKRPHQSTGHGTGPTMPADMGTRLRRAKQRGAAKVARRRTRGIDEHRAPSPVLFPAWWSGLREALRRLAWV